MSILERERDTQDGSTVVVEHRPPSRLQYGMGACEVLLVLACACSKTHQNL
jgi:hypothetical protein